MNAREIVAEILGMDPQERAHYLSQVCGGDRALLDEANALLRARVETAVMGSKEAAEPFREKAGSYIADNSPEAFIGPYRLIRELGEGGMGVVYQAQQLQPIHRDVALKIVKPGMDSKQVVARFETERQALAMMDHANIARVFDAGATTTGRPYFVMELVDGVPIRRYCDSRRLTVRERIELFIPVCHAIQHAHQKGIIHRDIKPSNVLVAQQDGKPAPKVIDFGLAKALQSQPGDATMMTSLGTIMGTLRYMSPEQADPAHHDIDTRSDVYSLGAVLYELLTGTTPLGQERLAKSDYVEILRRIREEEPPPPSARLRPSSISPDTAAQRRTDPSRLCKLVHGELDWIVMKALEKDRSRRYQTAASLACDLQRYLEEEPVEAGPPSATYRARKFVRKYRVWLATAGAFTALLVAAVVASSWMAIQANRAKEEARAVNDFLRSDLLAQASANKQARPDTKPEPELTVRTALDRAAERIEGKFAGQPLVEASIRQTVADTYQDLGLYPEAQRHVERALDLRRRALGEKHADTLSSMNRLVELFRLQGKYAQAVPLNEKVLDLRRKVLGEHHPDTLDAMHNLAILYGYLNKYADAEALFTKILDAQRRLLGDEHHTTLETTQDLATLYQRQGNYAKAEPLYVKAAEASRRALGEEHPSTLVSLSGVAVVYQMEGKYAQAEPLESSVLETQRRVLGDEHLFTLNTMNHLASVYTDEGKYRLAEALYNKTLAIQRHVLGEEHPETLLTMAGLATAYRSQGRYRAAEDLYREAIAIQSRVLGEEYRDTRATMNRLAELYRLEGNYAQAQALYLKVLDIKRRKVGEEHPDTLATMNSLALVYEDQGRYAEAEPLLRAAVSAYEKSNFPQWERYNSMSLLGASLVGQKRDYAEAERLLLSGYAGLREREVTIPAPSRSRVNQAADWIARLYQDRGQPDKAAEWEQRARLR